MKSELKTLEWDILNPNRLINLEIKKKHNIIWRLRKRGDQALISISTILKFSALISCNKAWMIEMWNKIEMVSKTKIQVEIDKCLKCKYAS